jgi:hypothetical protein
MKLQDGYSRGESVHLPSRVSLPEIDFMAIAEKSNILLTDELCEIIRCVLREYISLVQSWEDRPLSGERKKFLESLKHACELLESVFELDVKGTLEDPDPLLLFAWQNVVPRVECFFKEYPEGEDAQLVVRKCKSLGSTGEEGLPFDGKNVADYLSLCRENIERELDFPTRRGKRRKYAIKRCLNGLHQAYSMAGGEGRGCWWYEGEKGQYRGPFFEFAKGLLDYTDYSFPPKALGNQIMKNITSK